MKTIGMKVLLVAAAVCLVGCSKGGTGDAKGVAQKFWEAARTGEVGKVAPYVTKAGFELLKKEKGGDTEGMKKEGDFSFGAVTVDGDRARVETKVTDKGFALPFETIVIKEGGQWKVDAGQTMASVMTGIMGTMGQAGKELAVEENAAVPQAAPAEPLAAAPAGKALGVGDAVKVEWKGKWWPASVIEVGQNSRWKIHYDGYDNSWDEWVGPERIQAMK